MSSLDAQMGGFNCVHGLRKTTPLPGQTSGGAYGKQMLVEWEGEDRAELAPCPPQPCSPPTPAQIDTLITAHTFCQLQRGSRRTWGGA